MFTQLNPPVPLSVLGKGKGQAIAVIDYGPEHHLVWVTAIDETGEIWCAPNPKVRMQSNWTLGRNVDREPMGQISPEPCDDCRDLMRV